MVNSKPVTVGSCNQSVEVGTYGVGVHHRIKVLQVAMSRSTLKNARPLVPELGLALTARAGLGSLGSHRALRGPSFVSSLLGEWPIFLSLAKRSRLCRRATDEE